VKPETDEAAKARHLKMAEAWHHVAGSFEFVIKLEEFLRRAVNRDEKFIAAWDASTDFRSSSLCRSSSFTNWCGP